MSSTALARIDLPKAPLAQVGELQSAIAKIENQCNLLMPLAAQDYIPPLHRVSIRAVNITDKDTYVDRQWCKDGERAITKTGLMKILRARGASVKWSQRADDRSDPHYCEWSVMLTATEADGQVLDFPGAREIDLRDGSALASKMSEGQLRGARIHIVAMAETKAFHRAIRGLCGLQQKYSPADLKKPFVTFALVPDLPMDDPEVRRMAVSAMLSAQSALYGNGQGTQLPPAQIEAGTTLEGELAGEPIDVTDAFSEAVDDDDPFADDGVQAEPFVPITEDILSRCPTDREDLFNFLHSVNSMAEKGKELFGEDNVRAAFQKHATGIDWISGSPQENKAVKKAIIEELKGGAS